MGTDLGRLRSAALAGRSCFASRSKTAAAIAKWLWAPVDPFDWRIITFSVVSTIAIIAVLLTLA